jgi:hypothetical protein
MFIELSYESDIFKVLWDDFDFAPATIRVAGLRPDLPIGTYYDTLEVSARWAENKPQLVFIQVNYLAGIEPAEIIAMPSTIAVPYLKDSGPLLYEELEIFNVHGGCMAWTLEESLDWLSAVTPSGEVPGASSLLIDPAGYSIGEYPGVIQVTSPSATNSPFEIDMTLQVWKLHGDVNWDGNLTPQDIALMIDYIFNGQHPPQPTVAVGDVNCDEQVNITDIALMIESFYETLVPLCGNPY